jgi:hypothetical protein
MGGLRSARQATFALKLAKITISCSQVQRIAQQIGHEMAQQRDDKVVQQRRRQLPVRVSVRPDVVAVEVDGGRLRTRAPGCGPGVHEVQGKEEKVACLVSLSSAASKPDPQPEPPASFLQPRRVQRLVQQMKGQAGRRDDEDEEPEHSPEEPAETPAEREQPNPPEPTAAPDERSHPQPLVRTCLASMVGSDQFGPMMAAEAQERGFGQATRKAFIADGASGNWGIQRGYFPDYEPITDFLHALCYVYLAAWAVGGADAERWSLYERWLRASWQGRVGEVIAELEGFQKVVGVPPEEGELERTDPRRLVAEAINYLSNNQGRMDYPRYRCQGLPITSSWVESLVGQFNARVKDRKMFWNRPDGPEPTLQLRAAVLSEDDRLDRFFEQRPGNPYSYRRVA